MTRIQKLAKALSYLQNGTGIHLGEDVFLTGYLDGSDKIYGFGKQDDEIVVISRSTRFNISSLDREDIQYIFGLSVPNIFAKIQKKEYEIMNIEEI